MPYNNRRRKTDIDGGVTPQFFNDTLDDYEVHKGEDGASFVKVEGSKNISFGTRMITAAPQEMKIGLSNRRKLVLQVIGDDAVFIGDSSVTTSTGFPLLPGEKLEFTFSSKSTQKIYAVSDTQQEIRIIESN